MRRAAFLDRDGVFNVRPRPHEYVRSLGDFSWIDGAAEGAARLAHGGFMLAVVSNQRGVARGLVDPAVLVEIEEEIQSALRPLRAEIGAFRYCPHALEAGCECRKPQPGMLLSLARERGIDLSRSWMIGDSASDVIAGQRAGCATALIGDSIDAAALEAPPDLVARSLLAASESILSLDRVQPRPVPR